MHFLSALKQPFSKLFAASGNDILSEGETVWWKQAFPFYGAETQAGERVTLESLMTSATCFACTQALSETVAGLPGLIYRDGVNRKDHDPEHPAQELLTVQPNPEMDAFTFWDLMITRLTNSGNFYAEIQRNSRDEPVALWPLHPTRVRPVRDDRDGSLFWEITHDYDGTAEYQDPTWRRNHVTHLSSHHMLNVVGFGSRNGITSPGMLPAAEEVGVEFATRRYGADFFRSGASMSGVIEHPGFIDNPTQRNIFREDINAIHSKSRHKIGVIWQGAKYEQISVAPDQAQFLESRKFSSDQLCKFYGVAPAIIGDYEHSKFATADAMIRAFVMIRIRNLVVRCEKAINRQVLNVQGSNGKLERAFTKNLIYRIAIDGLLRGDPKQQAETHKVYRDAGILQTNEIREEIGYNPLPGPEGKYLIVQGGMARLDKIDEQGTRQSNAAKPAEDNTSASLPTFDRERLARMIEQSGLVETPTTVRGYDPKSAVREAAVRVAESAVERIDKITATQIERWKERDPKEVAEKMPEFFAKQSARLRDALAPLADLEAGPAVETITSAYAEVCEKLDNYSVFDSVRKIDTEGLVNAAFS